MRILFMGTPEFSLFSLKALVENGYDVVGAVTQTDKPRGRGYELQPSPVKVYAAEHGIPVYQPKTLRGEEFAATLAEINPDMIVVAAFGKILPENVLSFPRFGCLNIHGSLLPAYRGAAPMQRAIIEGQKKTGVTVMLMDVGLDTGDMLSTKEVQIEENDNFETVHDKLGEAGAIALLDEIDRIERGESHRTKQDDALSTYAAKIEKEDCLLDFTKSAEELHNLVRGLSPFPLSFTHTPDGKLLKITESRLYDREKIAGKPGEVLSDEGELLVACGKGILKICRLLPEGKGRMDADAYLRGRKLKRGDVLA